MFVIPYFSNTIDRIMFKRLFNHLSKHNMLYQKQFGFQNGHSNENAIIQLIDKINDNFENNCFTLGIFIGLLKEFETADHQILISNLKIMD